MGSHSVAGEGWLGKTALAEALTAETQRMSWTSDELDFAAQREGA